MNNVKVKEMIDTIREALILEYGYNFLKLSEKEQVLLMIDTWNKARTED